MSEDRVEYLGDVTATTAEDISYEDGFKRGYLRALKDTKSASLAYPTWRLLLTKFVDPKISEILEVNSEMAG